jgi:death on curing protein
LDVVYPELEDAFVAFEEATGNQPGTARDYVRSGSVDLIEGALARPRHYAVYDDSDIATQAAVLAHGIAETQPFIDGNKRTALELMAYFLRANGYVLAASDAELFEWILALGVDHLTPVGLADRLRPHLQAV